MKSRSAWFENGTEKARKLKKENSKRLIKSAISGNADKKTDYIFVVSFFYFRRVWFGQTTRRSIFVQQKAHEGVAALINSTVHCFSDSNGLLPREFEPDTGTGNGFFI